jgi:MFS family permease
MQGIGLAYAIDALLIIVSMIPLWLIKLETEPKQPNQTDSIMTSIQDGFSYVWQDASLRAFIIYMTITTFVSMGPQMVGMPVLADDNLNGMRSFGVLMSAQGLGAVFGSLLAAFATPAASLLGPVVMTLAIVRGFGTLLIAAITSDQQGILLMTTMGILTGYSSIVFMTWVQKRVSLEYIGRVMSLVMLAVMGLQPLSQGFSGWFIDFAGVTTLFISIGFFMIITPFFALLSADIRNMGEPKKTQQ